MNWKRTLLNALRVFSILSLILVIISGVFVNVKSWRTIGESNTIFQFINRCCIVCISFVLIFAEIELPRLVFRVFPVFDEEHSWAFQGSLQAWIGCFILGYDAGVAILPSRLSPLLIVPGWFSFLIGIIYMILALVGGTHIKAIRRGSIPVVMAHNNSSTCDMASIYSAYGYGNNI